MPSAPADQQARDAAAGRVAGPGREPKPLGRQTTARGPKAAGRPASAGGAPALAPGLSPGGLGWRAGPLALSPPPITRAARTRSLVLHAVGFHGARLSSSRAAHQKRSLRSRRCAIGIRRLRTASNSHGSAAMGRTAVDQDKASYSALL